MNVECVVWNIVYMINYAAYNNSPVSNITPLLIPKAVVFKETYILCITRDLTCLHYITNQNDITFMLKTEIHILVLC